MIPLDVILFYLFGGLTVAASIGVVAQRNPMHSVLLLITSFAGLAGLYINLDSPFTAVTQIIVYAGAIMVLFLFVVMLLNAPREDVPSPYGPAYVSSVREIGIAIFTEYSLAFEATSVLILVAMVGAVVLAKKKL